MDWDYDYYDGYDDYRDYQRGLECESTYDDLDILFQDDDIPTEQEEIELEEMFNE